MQRKCMICENFTMKSITIEGKLYCKHCYCVRVIEKAKLALVDGPKMLDCLNRHFSMYKSSFE